MPKKQKAFFLSQDSLTYVLLFVVIGLGFIFLVPKVASSLFPWKRQMVLQGFIEKVNLTKSIPAQAFWEFREFYSPGYYTFNKNGLSSSQVALAENYIHIPLRMAKGDSIFLTFLSPHLHSVEALVTENSLSSAIDIKNIATSHVVLSSSNQRIWKDNSGNMYIVFLKPISEMKTANGYFDYAGEDKSLVEGKYWLDITKLDGK